MRTSCASLLSIFFLSLLVTSGPASAEATWTIGHINNVTFVGDAVLIKTDSALPDNCAGTGNGWMAIPAAYKPIQALVLALWARGDSASVQVAVYTGPVAGGYCQITQIDPPG